MDIIEKVDNMTIQHGKYNDRIYLMKTDGSVTENSLAKLETISKNNSYSKIFAKIRADIAGVFIDSGYREEAAIENFYNGSEKAVFLGKYFTNSRKTITVDTKEKIHSVLATSFKKSQMPFDLKLEDNTKIRAAEKSDCETMADIYRIVFKSYPFPIHDPEYLSDTMDTHVRYFIAEVDGKPAALASSEIDKASENVEMTDFATLPEYLGRSLSLNLLAYMEDRMKNDGIITAYTIARAVSYGMNISFAKMGYKYGGTLANNTNISGDIECMNVWHKKL